MIDDIPMVVKLTALRDRVEAGSATRDLLHATLTGLREALERHNIRDLDDLMDLNTRMAQARRICVDVEETLLPKGAA